MHNAKCTMGRGHITFEGSEDDVTYNTLLLEEKRTWGQKSVEELFKHTEKENDT
jgi:hypothetical protein